MAYIPSYIKLHKKGLLKRRIETFRERYESCRICPHDCEVNRFEADTGICNTGANAMVSSASSHKGEERPLVSENGSGTIFFTGCNMKCAFCQNHEISQLMYGSEINTGELSDLMITLQEEGNLNINFVSPSHMTLQILEALELAIDKGLKIPLVYNTGGYDSVETLQLLDGIFDIYMPDIKYSNNETAWEFSKVKNYKEISQAAVKEMYRQVGNLKMDKNGIAKKGLMVRHLLLPGYIDEAKEVIDFVTSISKHTYLNIMKQYRPYWNALKIEMLNRQIGNDEYQNVKEYALSKGLYRIA